MTSSGVNLFFGNGMFSREKHGNLLRCRLFSESVALFLPGSILGWGVACSAVVIEWFFIVHIMFFCIVVGGIVEKCERGRWQNVRWRNGRLPVARCGAAGKMLLSSITERAYVISSRWFETHMR
jgi:hypothetical protein